LNAPSVDERATVSEFGVGALAPARLTFGGVPLPGLADGHSIGGTQCSFSRFLGVGSVGFVVDSSTFMALSAVGLSPAVARALSMILGTFVVWQLNRRFTFVRSGRRHAVEGGLYAAVALVAQGLSYTVFLVLIYAVPEIHRAVSFVFGCGLGAVVGFTGHHLLTFAPALRPASR
jgi:putative flippase GtrA